MRAWAILVLTALIAACATSTNPGATGVQRSQLLLLPSDSINSQAALAYTQLSTAASKANKLNADPVLAKRVKDVADRLIAQVGVFRADASSWQWEVNVFERDELNAFCAAGGKIAVFTGLVRRLDLSDEEIAAVVGHEIAHALREHTREKASQQTLSKAVVQAVAQSGSRSAAAQAQLAALGAQLFLHLPYSREMELEADLMGLELMARGGYDPSQAPNVWRKMRSVGSGKPPEFLNTHPDDDRRLAQLEASLPEVAGLYEAAQKPSTSIASTARSGAAAGGSSATATVPLAPLSGASLLAARPVTVAMAPKPLETGQDSWQVRKLATGAGCDGTANAKLISKGPGFELYTVACGSGDVVTYRCEFGNCRELK